MTQLAPIQQGEIQTNRYHRRNEQCGRKKEKIILTVMLFDRKQLDQFKTTRRARDLKRSLGGLNRAVEIRREREGGREIKDIKGNETRREK